MTQTGGQRGQTGGEQLCCPTALPGSPESPAPVSGPVPFRSGPFMSLNPQSPHRHRPPFPAIPGYPRGVPVVPRSLLTPVGSPPIPPPSQLLPQPSAAHPSIFLFPLLLLAGVWGSPGRPPGKPGREGRRERAGGTAGHRQDRSVENPKPGPVGSRPGPVAPDPAPAQFRLPPLGPVPVRVLPARFVGPQPGPRGSRVHSSSAPVPRSRSGPGTGPGSAPPSPAHTPKLRPPKDTEPSG